jgi:phage antirepressor YoqD-like protein
MTIKETAKILRVSENQLRANIDSWGIPYIQNGNRKIILTERFFREFLRVPENEIKAMRI